MSDNKELEELKSIINSLIVPNPNGLSLRHLCNDYYEIEGQSIPFAKFGFTSVTALLKSMPDMVHMVGNLADINSVTLYPVRNEANRHIVDLVRGQNKTKKKRGKPRPTFYPTRYPTWASHPLHRPSAQRPISRSFGNLNRNPYRPPLLPNCVPTPLLRPPLLAMTRMSVPFTPQAAGLSSPLSSPGTADLINKFQNFTITRPQVPNNVPTSQVSRPSRSATDLNSVAISNGKSTTASSTTSGGLPQNIKENIGHLMSLEDMADGMMLYNFQARYKHQFKEVLDHKKYGFDSLVDCLKSVPHLIEMIGIGKTFKLMPNKNPIQTELTKEKSNSPPESPVANGFTQMTRTVLSPKKSPENSKTIRTMPLLMRTVRTDSTSTSSDNSPARVLSTVTTAQSSTPTTSLSAAAPTIIQPTLPKVVATVNSNGSQSTKIKTSPTFKLTVKPQTTAVIATPSPDSHKSENLKENLKQKEPMPSISREVSPIAFPTDTESVMSGESTVNLNPIAKQNFRRVLMAHENGIKAADFPREYQRICNVSFDSRIWGYRTAMDLFIGLPYIFTIAESDKKHVVLHDARFKKFEPPKNINRDPSVVYRLTSLPDRIKARIVRLVQMCGTTGLAVDDFIRFYTMTYEPLDFSSLKVPDANYLFEAIKHDLPIHSDMVHGQKRAFINSAEEVRDWVVTQARLHRFVVPITMVDTPANSVLPGEEFQPIILPERFQPGNYEYVAIYISSAVNPQEIYIQFKGMDYHSALERLMHKLDFYETAPPEQWSVPYEFLYAGFPVICKYPGDRHFHRAKIHRIHPNNKKMVTVSFVDYGGTTVVDYTCLRLMKREFFQLPVQALKVGLYGIRPYNGLRASDWTSAARDKILKFSKPMYALACTLIKVKDGVHWVAICDTNTDTDIFLHSVLVGDKHAALKSEDELDEEEEVNGQANGF